MAHLFESQSPAGPLANRMRPQNLDEIVGQRHLIGETTLLRRAILADRLGTVIFYGPPGTGKTTLARVISSYTKSAFEQLNAVTAKLEQLREILKAAEARLQFEDQKTILFLDEIHRFNKMQQDALLPALEAGTITLIGATTENPSFEVNAALLSRATVFRFEPPTPDDLRIVLDRTLKDEERGLGKYPITITDDAIDHYVKLSDGDYRALLNALELAVLTTPEIDGQITIDLAVAEESIQQKALKYDKDGDRHYDVISAFIKSIRGSDPDAALYWLAVMIEAGESPRFIVRRLYVHAAEDIGLSDPQALLMVDACARACEYVGFPEARIPLAETVLYLATAPKSNAVISAIDQALTLVRRSDGGPVPPHLRDAHHPGAAALGNGVTYQYPHDFEHAYVPQNYWPENLARTKPVFYRPSPRGFEKQLQARLDFWHKQTATHQKKRP
ncbi:MULTISPECIES: replication-associated recombination protein A [unclassified Exiguobacterium]|uniref:replication-associated recombination protein A n=1 Tax=unclassified Exiguobacterium TaxID=2644629 RepID=UPI001BE86AE8|nr:MULTISPECIES: replication-associated recombination protein A [unclassified Exiguobacterium]